MDLGIAYRDYVIDENREPCNIRHLVIDERTKWLTFFIEKKFLLAHSYCKWKEICEFSHFMMHLYNHKNLRPLKRLLVHLIL